MQFSQELWLTIVPIFVAIDAIGTLPIIISLSQDMSRSERRKMVNLALFTASVLALVFLFLGRAILRTLGIAVGHFAVAGGLVLLALALRDLTTGRMIEMPRKEEIIAIVPIGTPLTVGPATLTTLLLLSDQYSLGIVLLSLALNLAAAWLIFLQANRIAGFLGEGGLRAVSKVMSLLLAAIAVKMIFYGLAQVWIS